jgi:mannan endo-1,4-beta-mannosidase
MASDPRNCGACGAACAPGVACAGSLCGGSSVGAGGSQGAGGSSGVGGSVGVGGNSSSGGQGSGGAPAGGGASSGGADVGSGGDTAAGGSSGDCTATGFYVEAGLLYDANCNEFTMRGINYPYAWYSTRDTQADFAAMAAAGANSVRIVMATGDRWDRTAGATVTSLINWAKAAQMIAVLEVHDVTGYAEQADSVPLSAAQSYWTAADITGALIGQEAFVLINVANEPNGNDTSPDDWAPSHIAAVQAMRSAGLHHTLVVDAPNWGQDWENTMRDGGGASIWQADAEKNMIFSVHMYDVYGSANTVTSYFNTFLDAYEAPLIVGEFAADHGSSGDVDEATIMSFAEMLGIGYLGWSWSGNGSGLETLDMTTNFTAASLTAWGTTITSGANGLMETSDVCTVFQ